MFCLVAIRITGKRRFYEMGIFYIVLFIRYGLRRLAERREYKEYIKIPGIGHSWLGYILERCCNICFTYPTQPNRAEVGWSPKSISTRRFKVRAYLGKTEVFLDNWSADRLRKMRKETPFANVMVRFIRNRESQYTSCRVKDLRIDWQCGRV